MLVSQYTVPVAGGKQAHMPGTQRNAAPLAIRIILLKLMVAISDIENEKKYPNNAVVPNMGLLAGSSPVQRKPNNTIAHIKRKTNFLADAKAHISRIYMQLASKCCTCSCFFCYPLSPLSRKISPQPSTCSTRRASSRTFSLSPGALTLRHMRSSGPTRWLAARSPSSTRWVSFGLIKARTSTSSSRGSVTCRTTTRFGRPWMRGSDRPRCIIINRLRVTSRGCTGVSLVAEEQGR